MKQVIVFDIDGVLAAFTEAFTTAAHQRFGTPVIVDEEQPTWDFDNILTAEQTQAVWGDIHAHPDFWGFLVPCVTGDDVASMHEAFNGLSNFELVYLTNRAGRGVSEVTAGWLWQYGFPHGRVVLTDDKVRLIASMQRMGKDVVGIIEDSPKNLEAMWEAGLPAWCLSRRYNEELDGPRVRTVSEFLRMVSRAAPLTLVDMEV